MKKILFLLLVLFAVTGPASAQYIHHDVSASYGIITTDQIVDVIKDVLIATFSFGTYTKDDYHYSGALFVTYRYSPSYRINVGACLGIDRVSGDLLTNDVKVGQFTTSHTTLAIEADYRYVKSDFFQLYSGLGLGYTFSVDSGTLDSGEEGSIPYGHMNMQVNLLGMRIGKKLAAFGELGFGYKGLVNLGLSYAF